jgi:hypothetical protein
MLIGSRNGADLMHDPWRQWEQDSEANQLLDAYARRSADTPLSRIAVEGEATESDGSSKRSAAKETARPHAILLALGWVEPVWSEAGARGKPLGYKVVAAGKEWQQKKALRSADQLDEESA